MVNKDEYTHRYSECPKLSTSIRTTISAGAIPLLKTSVQRTPHIKVQLSRRQVVMVGQSVSDTHGVLFHRVSVIRPSITILRPVLQYTAHAAFSGRFKIK